jgi:hypothetical protein
MAITVTTPTPGKFGWLLNGVSADASGCEELKAAPAAGLSIVVDRLTINCGAAALSLTIGQGVAAGAVETALIGPIAMAANTSLPFDFGPYGMVLAAAKSLTVDASGAGAICVFARGRVE